MRSRPLLLMSASLAILAYGASTLASAQSVVVTQPDGTRQAIPLAPTSQAPAVLPPQPMPPPAAPMGQGTLGSVAVGGSLAAPGGPPPIVIAGSGVGQSADCAGRDVEIDGSGGNHVLRGGCRSIAIRGSNNVVNAEILPGTRIAMMGSDNQVAFVLTEPGPDPIVSVAGSNDRAWRVQRLGAAPNSGIEVGAAGIAVPGGAGARVTEMPSVPQLMQQLGAVQTEQGTLVQMSNDVLFNFDSAAIRPDAALKLTQLAQLIDQLHPPGLRIVGNADNIGTDPYNMALSLRRARSVENWLTASGGVRVASMDVKGEGFHDPVAPNQNPDGTDNPAGRQKNRRVDVLIEK
jgi:outer membrane protein OmpA-like peptidoglycan-associated protein